MRCGVCVRHPHRDQLPCNPVGFYSFMFDAHDLENGEGLGDFAMCTDKVSPQGAVCPPRQLDNNLDGKASTYGDNTSTNAFPDGGLKAWTVVFGAFVALFCTFGQLYSFGTFQLYYSEHQLQNLSPSTISWIGSIQLGIFFAGVSRHLKNRCAEN